MARMFELEQTQEVAAALEICLEEVEATIEEFSSKVGEVFAESDRETLERLLRRKFEMENFREAVKDLQKQWARMWNGRGKKRRKKKLPRGLRTPQEQFVRPLLEALVELGGEAEAGKVIDLVGEKMKGELNEYDKEPLSNGQPRWRNTVQWCRLDLVREGLLNPDSPHGIWEITKKGEAYLESLKG